MAQVYPNIFRQKLWEQFLNTTLSLRLFSNNITPVVTDTIGTYVEVIGGGYAAKSVTFGGWNVSLANPTVASRIIPLRWDFTGVIGGTGTVYGYYLIRTSDNLLVVSELLPAPYIPVNGGFINLTLTLKDRQP